MVRSRPTTILRPAPAALPRPVPMAPLEHPTGGGHLHETSTGVHSRSPITPDSPEPPEAGKPPLPAGLLLTCSPRMEQELLRLLPQASHPAVTHDARRGGDRPLRTDPGTTPSTSAEPPNGASHFTHAPSRRTQAYVASTTTRGARAKHSGGGDATRLVDHSVHQRVDSPMRI